ncbi:TetR family transcriptional regulator [bacterium]|nr:TetR family transcriptional regulator [bacterium]
MARTKAFDEEIVLEQAMQVFRERGYAATSIRDLVEAVGVNSSSLYNAFGDKDAIFLRVLVWHSQGEKEMVRRELAESADPRATLAHLFADLIDELLGEEAHHGSLTLKAAVELGVSKPVIFDFLRSYMDEITQLFTDFLQAAVDRGELRLHQPAPDVARYLLFAFYNLSFLVKMYPERAGLESYVQVVLNVME